MNADFGVMNHAGCQNVTNLFCIEMQPRAKSKVFTSVDIFFHSVTAVFYLFLPQSCHSESRLTIIQGRLATRALFPSTRHSQLG